MGWCAARCVPAAMIWPENIRERERLGWLPPVARVVSGCGAWLVG